MGSDSALSVRSVLREPTLHFVILAAALFAVRVAFRTDERYVIRVASAAVDARAARAESEGGSPLTPEQRAAVERAVVDEAILAREARALGLDDDPRIDDILVQKMLHVLSGDVIQPSDAELAAYWEQHKDRYVDAGRITFDEVVFETDRPLPEALRDQLAAGVEASALRANVPLRTSTVPEARATDLAAAFGTEMAAKIATGEVGTWVGPHRTVRGEHWFRVSARSGGEAMSLERARTAVREDWIREREEALLGERVNELRERYRVVREESPGER